MWQAQKNYWRQESSSGWQSYWNLLYSLLNHSKEKRKQNIGISRCFLFNVFSKHSEQLDTAAFLGPHRPAIVLQLVDGWLTNNLWDDFLCSSAQSWGFRLQTLWVLMSLKRKLLGPAYRDAVKVSWPRSRNLIVFPAVMAWMVSMPFPPSNVQKVTIFGDGF